MSWIIIIALIVVGFLFIILEILVLPGFIVGLLGLSLVILGIFESFHTYGASAGYLTILGTLIFAIIGAIIVFRYRTWNKLMLHEEIDGKVNLVETDKIKPGDKGKTISKLAIGGKALINGSYCEVFSTGEYIDSGEEIEVLKVDENKIIVKKI